MDCGNGYILMCEKAVEIQEIWHKADVSLLPSFVLDIVTGSISIMIWTPEALGDIIRKVYPSQGNSLIASVEWWDDKHIGYEDEDDKWRSDTIWLPRQDQLQEMVGKSWWEALWDLWAWCDSGPKQFTSMEQLWLAFVMFELYHKEWYNGGWRLKDGNRG